MTAYRRLMSVRGAWMMLSAKAAGMIPGIGFVLAATLLVRGRTGSYALAGASVAAAGFACVLAGPLAARWVTGAPGLASRHRRLLALACGLAASLSAFVAISLAGAPGWLFVAAGAGVGLADPPIGALLRARWSEIAAGELARAAHAWESATSEALYVIGPALAAGALAVGAPEALLGAYAILAVAGWARFCKVERDHPARPAAARPGPPAAAPSAPGPGPGWLLAAVAGWSAAYDVACLGLVSWADSRGLPGAGGILVALLSAGGIAGGLLYGASRRRRCLRRDLTACLGAYGLLLAAPLAGGLAAAAAACLAAGLASGVVYSAAYVWAQQARGSRRLGEAYARTAAAMTLGAAAGALAGGALAAAAGPGWTLAGAGACSLAAALAARRAPALEPPRIPGPAGQGRCAGRRRFSRGRATHLAESRRSFA